MPKDVDDAKFNPANEDAALVSLAVVIVRHSSQDPDSLHESPAPPPHRRSSHRLLARARGDFKLADPRGRLPIADQSGLRGR